MSFSMDTGCYASAIQDAFDGILKLNLMPKKDGRSQANQPWSECQPLSRLVGGIKVVNRRSTILSIAVWIGFEHRDSRVMSGR